MSVSQSRLKVLEKIEELEKEGLFDRDVEDDPPTTPLVPGTVDYTNKKLWSKIAARFASILGEHHFEGMLRRGDVVLKEIRGRENLDAIKSCGALITCNHFNAFDNYAVNKAISPALKSRYNLYKIIREGNYTSFGGFYGFLFRHCNTLPLSSNLSCLKELMSAISTLLDRGEKILIYPEQGMWYNYRKPRPLKLGAFRFAAKSHAPVLPIFITLEDTEALDADGMPVQAYTVHILPAIFPNNNAGIRENSEYLCRKNYEFWKATYESFYQKKLEYTTNGEVDPCSI
ncbi:MAG: 1-acyl-sn-glycerol-3-phosphate acyltransferase [Ruminococcaceae bacterium]|nr:1-acyl-sn-glycerol-3-phosphate acyltransferase [Oscillospiraceae bacterium]